MKKEAKLFYATNGRLGTDNSSFFYDLKTVLGVKKRIIAGLYAEGDWKIFRVDSKNIFDESEYREILRFTKRI